MDEGDVEGGLDAAGMAELAVESRLLIGKGVEEGVQGGEDIDGGEADTEIFQRPRFIGNGSSPVLVRLIVGLLTVSLVGLFALEAEVVFDVGLVVVQSGLDGGVQIVEAG